MSRVRLLVCAVDGVLTDGTVLYGVSGGDQRSFHAADLRGAALLGAAGIAVALLCPRPSHSIESLARDMGATHHVDPDRARAFEAALSAAGVGPMDAAAMGRDVEDLPMMARARMSFAPPDAEAAVVAAASIVTIRPGGRGAFRDAVEDVLAGTLVRDS